MLNRTLRRAAAAFSLVVVTFLPAALASRAEAVEVQRVVSPGGIEAWLVEEHSNPILALSFSVLGGSASDPQGKEGLARMTAALLDEGAGDLDSQAFQGELDRLSIDLSFSAGSDELYGNVTTLTANRERALELLTLALTQPRFDEEPVERIRSQIQLSLSRKADNPNAVAQEALAALLFPGHPYGRPSDGTAISISGIVRDDLTGYVDRTLARDSLKIGVVGDITPAELAPLLDQVFGTLPAQGSPAAVPEVTAAGGGVTKVIELPVPQSVLLLAQPGPKRADPDYYAATVVDYVLGGGSFSSRLYEEVREKRGLAYSVWSTLQPRDEAGLWLAGTATQNARAGESLDIIREQWAGLAKDGPTQEEVDKAITYLTGSFPLRLTSSDGIAQILVSMQREDLGIDYLDKRNAFYESLTLEDVRRVAQTWLDPAKLAVVVVGKPQGIEASGQTE